MQFCSISTNEPFCSFRKSLLRRILILSRFFTHVDLPSSHAFKGNPWKSSSQACIYAWPNKKKRFFQIIWSTDTPWSYVLGFGSYLPIYKPKQYLRPRSAKFHQVSPAHVHAPEMELPENHWDLTTVSCQRWREFSPMGMGFEARLFCGSKSSKHIKMMKCETFKIDEMRLHLQPTFHPLFLQKLTQGKNTKNQTPHCFDAASRSICPENPHPSKTPPNLLNGTGPLTKRAAWRSAIKEASARSFSSVSSKQLWTELNFTSAKVWIDNIIELSLLHLLFSSSPPSSPSSS